MQKCTPSYMEQRLEALAVVHLTRRDDLVVTNPNHDLGIDLLVHLAGEKRTERKTFGVILKGTTKSLSTEREATRTLNSMARSRGAHQFTMPICMLFFSMQDDDGYYAWKVEPCVQSGKPRLVSHPTLHCRRLSTQSMGEIVAAVDRWHDALFKFLTE